MKDEIKFAEVIAAISSALANPVKPIGHSILITIDGPAGSGKTTLAKRISEHFLHLTVTTQVIHVDDLYNGWDDALGESLTRTFLESLLPGVASGQAYFLPRFDWVLKEFSHSTSFFPADLVIVEGVGAGQSVMRERATLSIWIEVNDEIGLIRVLNRDGAGIRKVMHNFQIAQREHFLKEKTKESADFRFDGAP